MWAPKSEAFKDLSIAPQPEQFSELYFINTSRLPVRGKGGTPQDIAFAIHNHEYRRVIYTYALAIRTSDSKSHTIKQATITLAPEEKKIIQESITLPELNERITISVNLTGNGQSHSIDYWTTITSVNRGGSS